MAVVAVVVKYYGPLTQVLALVELTPSQLIYLQKERTASAEFMMLPLLAQIIKFNPLQHSPDMTAHSGKEKKGWGGSFSISPRIYTGMDQV